MFSEQLACASVYYALCPYKRGRVTEFYHSQLVHQQSAGHW